VIQHDDSNAVLMMGFMNAEALERTRTTGEVHFFSRSRNELWHKGGTSGHVQKVRSIAINCDRNSLLIRVEQVGAVCHDGYATCYYRDLLPDDTLETNQERLFDPRDVYGDGFGLAGLTRQWWGAYEYLRDTDLGAESGTSRTLRTSNANVLDRLRGELNELAGVLDGSHVHTGQASDLLLEGSQCCYWIVVQSLLLGLGRDDVRPDRALDVAEASVGPAMAATILRAEARALNTFSAGVAMHLLQLVAESARTLGIDPRALIEHDLAELRQRPYLAAYFSR
jgi:phosphoribosyl-AMP cyclohydrolase